MLIGLVADTHDDEGCIAAAVAQMLSRRVDMVLHAGDITGPDAVALFSTLRIPIEAVFGNCDSRRSGLRDAMRGWGNIEDGPRRINVPGAAIMLMHEPRVCAQGDILVSGHTHVPSVIRDGRRLFVNPGECSGRRSGHATMAVLSLPDMAVEMISLKQREAAC